MNMSDMQASNVIASISVSEVVKDERYLEEFGETGRGRSKERHQVSVLSLSADPHLCITKCEIHEDRDFSVFYFLLYFYNLEHLVDSH